MIARNVALLLAVFLLITILMVSACSKAGEHSLDNVPTGWKSIVSPGNVWRSEEHTSELQSQRN